MRERVSVNNRSRYEFREVVCCKCNHKFMWEKSSEWQYSICQEDKEDIVKLATCPKCGSKIFVKEGVLESIDFDEDNSRVVMAVLRGI